MKGEMMTLPGFRKERLRRCMTLGDVSTLSGVAWNTVAKADRGEGVMVTTAGKLLQALESRPISELAQAVFEDDAAA